MKRLLFSISALAFLSACSQSVTVDLSSTFLKYTVLSKSSAIADGFTNLAVEVKVEDQVGQPVPNFIPKIKPSVSVSNSTLGVNYFNCAPSNDEGISLCNFRSHYEGLKSFTIEHASESGDKEVDVTFSPSPEKIGQMFEVVSSAHKFQTTSNGDQIGSTAGKMFDKPRQRMGGNEWLFRADVTVKY